ncbi:peptide ABC transporter substrate-binding protein [Vibrio casei]|uniref:Peptide ABC transporter substrate-binding protein n=1 Tax=Vibrio casei TaxID=673372 RepID=A0A368LMQ6_9VIBR|nr:peptide ABC transporter substrate-binding protein [Vibrio casei]RCS73189.1 peptide ABC transporter substrate-binding protein [Vibrio casei]SJN41247.1 Oligopeptide ABC transporter, periplasmic oligopeptide-binding protein OppA (TC 3.A.1.5.1) [Vibrio casei]
MQKMTKTLLATTISLCLAAPTFAAQVPAGVDLADKQEIVRGNGDEVPTLDPNMSSDTASSRVIADMFEGLVTEDLHGNIIPALASQWDVSEDGKQYTFHLRDAKWSNGEPITANDFVFSLKRIVDPKTGAPYSWYIAMASIVNGDEITKGEKPVDSLGVKSLDDKTLQITLTKPVPYFTKMLAHESTFALPEQTVKQFKESWTKPEHIVVSGAYKLSDWVINEKVVLERNKQYWNDKETVINKVTYLPISDVNAEYNRFRTGEIDITNVVPLELYQTIKQDRPDELLTMPSLGTYYYLFNMEKKPFDDPRVRKALAYSLDRDVIVERILGQGQLPAYTNTPPAVAGFEVPKLEWADMSQQERNQKAKALLKEAGFDKEHPLKFDLGYNTSEAHKKLAIVAASMWKKNLGAEVEIANQEWKTFLQTLSSKNFSVARYAWIGDYNEASTFLSYFDSSGLNYGGWSNADYDSALKMASLAKTEDERKKLYQQAEKIFAKEMPAIPVYFYTRSVLKNKNVGGYSKDNASDRRYTRDLYITK